MGREWLHAMFFFSSYLTGSNEENDVWVRGIESLDFPIVHFSVALLLSLLSRILKSR